MTMKATKRCKQKLDKSNLESRKEIRELPNNEDQIEKIWKALGKYGIKTEAELNEAIKKMKPLNIGCMVSPVTERRSTVAQ